jgi:hypothetical protein
MGIVAGGIDEQSARCLLRYLLTLCALPAGWETAGVRLARQCMETTCVGNGTAGDRAVALFKTRPAEHKGSRQAP